MRILNHRSQIMDSVQLFDRQIRRPQEALSMRFIVICFIYMALAVAAHAVPSLVQPINDRVTMVYDDAGNWGGNNWGGDMSTNITHQSASSYQARKILDLSEVPPPVWDQAQTVRLSVFMMVHDYSFMMLPNINGLDKAFQVVINGQVHEYPTNVGAPVLPPSGPPPIDWYDLVIPKAELKRGPNEIIIRKAPGKIGKPEATPDDYLYLGIDTSRKRGNSAVAFDGTTWTQEMLTVPGGNGEYMVRIYLISGDSTVQAVWRPGQTPPLDDPTKLILYAGAHGMSPSAEGCKLAAGQSARLEWEPGAFDMLAPIRISVQARGPVQLEWLGAQGTPAKDPAIIGLTADLPAGRRFRPSGARITAAGNATVESVTIEGSRFHPSPQPINMTPLIAAPPRARPQRPECRVQPQTVTLTGGFTQAVFERGGNLRLRSLKNLITNSEMLRHPDEVALFLIEVNGKRYAGSKDFKLMSVKPAPNGFVAELEGPNGMNPHFLATMNVSADKEGLRMGMNLVNIGDAPVDFKLAFPHLSGLAVSANPEEDYYFYPFGGGIIADVPTLIRHGYGDYEALYQVMDVFSPALGCGLSIRAEDTEGWHKILTLRKYVPDRPVVNERKVWVDYFVRQEYRWGNSLDADVEGTSFSYEYLRRTRAPLAQAAAPVPGDAASLQHTASFTPAAAVIAVHPGDWHVAMQSYADWAHRVWKFRPYPSALRSVRNMMPPGWGQDILFKDGSYRTDFIGPMTDCVELMSWWEWSPLGPFNTPLDQLDKVLTPAKIKALEPYIVKDPVTGQKMWNNQPGDYKGYNERFGGLPAFRKAVRTYQDMGVLVTLYTDPFRLDGNNEIGRKFGKEWSVVGRDDKKCTGYEVWNPCHGLAEVREWVATTMGRVMRETGADGIRLDEYGHRGWACYDNTHRHTYQEPGITQWQKGVAEAVKRAHAEMDKVKPALILTTEYPGYDYMMQYLDGCITYDLTVLKSPLRPLECNAQRFYFPECKVYELDLGPDPQCRKRFWNGEECFERIYPVNMNNILNENEDVYQGRETYPLSPTLQPHLYANRFRGAGKTMIHLYNTTGHTFDGPALTLSPLPQHGRGVVGEGTVHAIELLRGEELPIVGGNISVYLERDDVACVAILPRLLQVNPQGQVQIKDGKGGQLVFVNKKGENVSPQGVTGKSGALDLGKLPVNTKLTCLKLLRTGRMVDAVQWR